MSERYAVSRPLCQCGAYGRGKWRRPTNPSVDAYIAAQPEASRPVLETVRAAIRSALPDAQEVISYQIPPTGWAEEWRCSSAGWKKHYFALPATEALVAAFADEIGGSGREGHDPLPAIGAGADGADRQAGEVSCTRDDGCCSAASPQQGRAVVAVSTAGLRNQALAVSATMATRVILGLLFSPGTWLTPVRRHD